jgi:type I restriction enzyme S subunit
MIANLQPYPEYKESGSRWLAAVPSHWEVRNLRTLIRPRTERNRADLPLLSVAREKGVFVRSLTDEAENHNVIPEDLSNYKVARAGNLVINKMKAWQGSMGIAPCDGIVSPAYFVFDFAIANHAFGQILLRSKPYVAHFGQASDGVRVGQWDLTIPAMRQIPVLGPPAEEQAAMVRFLDYANGRLERAIRAKRQVIALLAEQKQAIIHRAVTRGLDPTAPLKPSGIPWLGDIPKHWETVRVCRLFKQVARYTARGDEPKMSMSRHYGLVRSETLSNRAAQAATSIKFSVCVPGDLVVNKYQAHNGLFGAAIERGLITSNYSVFGPVGQTFTKYFALLFASPIYKAEFRMRCQGVGDGMMPLYSSAFLKTPTVSPPAKEQEAIVAFITDTTKEVSQTIARLEREIGLLREYRTRLVADVVTGKLDVRAAARQLPAEPAAPAAPVEPEELTELEEKEIENA